MLRYGLTQTPDGPLICTEIDGAFSAEAERINSQFPIQLATAQRMNVLRVQDSGEGVTALSYDFAAMMRKRKPELREHALEHLKDLLCTVCYTPTTDGDPRLQAELGTRRIGTGRLVGTHFRVKWPDASKDVETSPDAAMTAAVSTTMRGVARSLQYVRESWDTVGLDEFVFASIDRRQGVLLETNDLGQCNAATYDGYDPEAARMMLDEHNIFSFEQQAILLSGAIALAHYDDLLQPTA